MWALAGEAILRIWEDGLARSPVGRALTILTVAFPDQSWETLAGLSIGDRDARLYAVRERVFGGSMPILAVCPACQESLEFSLNSADMDIGPHDEWPGEVYAMTTESYEIQFRVPTSADLLGVEGCADDATARDLLIERCVVKICRDAETLPTRHLPDAARAALAAAMADRDPHAEVQLDVACPACGHRWPLILDITAFFWREIHLHAKRLLREVDLLARAYGWREADILAMGEARRRAYLEMVW